MAPSNDTEFALRLGRVEGELAATRRELGDVKDQLSEALDLIRDMRDDYAKAQGGVRVVLAVGSVVAALGAVVAWGVSTYLKITGRS